MTRSPLMTENVSTTQQSARNQAPRMAILHHGATTSADQIVNMMVSGSRQVSAHAVVKDGRRIGVVEEENRAWSLSSADWDSAAFTVETANESTNGWTISDASHESLALLVADWAKRYGWKPHRSGDPRTWTVIGHREVYTIHGASYATACPGGMNLDWIVARAQQILNPVIELRSSTMPTIVPLVAGTTPALTGKYRLIGESGKTIDVAKVVGEQIERALKGQTMYGSAADAAAAAFKQVAPDTVAAPVIDYDKLAALIPKPPTAEQIAAAVNSDAAKRLAQ